MVGELLTEQGGKALYDTVEVARKAAIGRREREPGAERRLPEIVEDLDAAAARNFIRAFSTYFQVVNTAELVHRIRRRRDYLKDSKSVQPGSLVETLSRLKDAGVDAGAAADLIADVRLEPVFTAHPTEPTRRTILRKQQNIVRRMVEMQNPALTPQEVNACFESVRADVTAIWQTDEHPSEKMTVFDELEHVLFYMTDVIYRVIPAFYETVEEAFQEVYQADAGGIRIPSLLRFASGVGGDMTGGDEINARTIRQTLARQRNLILDLYHRECLDLAERLSQSTTRVTVSEELEGRIQHYSGQFPNARGLVPTRHRDMRYRVLLRLIAERIKATYDDDAYAYESYEELVGDLQIVASSLNENRGLHAGLFSVRRLIRRVETFGFHFMSLDLRQDSLKHRDVVGHALGEESWLDETAAHRTERIRHALEHNESPIVDLDNEAKRALSVFQAIAYCRRKYGSRAIGPFVVSQSHGVDDVLSVLLLALWGDLRYKSGGVPLDVAPIFETVEDLTRSASVVRELLADSQYRNHLGRRRNRQTVVVAYPESNLIGGMTFSRWTLQRAQAELATVLDDAGVDFTLFQDWGSIVSGGSKTQASVLGAPAGTIRGRYRATEQGEAIASKFGVRGIAVRTLERTLGSVLVSSASTRATETSPGSVPENWNEIMDAFSAASCQTYSTLVFESPGFADYFRTITPVDVIERMRMGDIPMVAPVDDGHNVSAQIWGFAWAQCRIALPGWYGFGAGYEAARESYGAEELESMAAGWPFFKSVIADVELLLGKSDMRIGWHYSQLAGDLHGQFFPVIREEYERCLGAVLALTGQEVVMQNSTSLRRSIRLRNPYVDPMSLLQVELLKRWRAADSPVDDETFSALLASVNGIARGLQDAA
jgi:phosphoenolpyruvate carboxylase